MFFSKVLYESLGVAAPIPAHPSLSAAAASASTAAASGGAAASPLLLRKWKRSVEVELAPGSLVLAELAPNDWRYSNRILRCILTHRTPIRISHRHTNPNLSEVDRFSRLLRPHTDPDISHSLTFLRKARVVYKQNATSSSNESRYYVTFLDQKDVTRSVLRSKIRSTLEMKVQQLNHPNSSS